ncbi:hypothetical protein AMTR_s00137p00054140 [Amborella trichopoda]|uniref:Uncharacterized protein n=1 Tax=Amborella trichopoda TaxID=13333 RepID=W1NEQ3_AMBTC|nr:hypothetical protein AMTR_s00137p00054140 [Amborella trichopoda]
MVFKSSPKTPDCVFVEVVAEVPSEPSSAGKALGDVHSPKPLVNQLIVNFPELLDCDSSPSTGCVILRLLAHDDITDADNFDGFSFALLSSLDAEACVYQE